MGYWAKLLIVVNYQKDNQHFYSEDKQTNNKH